MMIIYGWANQLRRNVQPHYDQCEFCGRIGYLRSYDATKFASLYYVPLLPVGNTHVIDECRICQMARVMPLREYRKLRRDELEPTIADYLDNPRNTEQAEAALGAIVTLGDADRFTEVVLAIEQHIPHDATVLARLGWAYSYFNMPEESKAAFAASLAHQPNDNLKQFSDALHFQPRRKPPRAPSRAMEIARVMPLPAAALLIVGIILTVANFARINHVQLVGGLDVAYKVNINGQIYDVPANGSKTIDLPFGEVRVQPVAGDMPIQPDAFRVEPSFISRAFDDTVLVINPDRVAVIEWEEVGYAVNISNAGRSLYTMHANRCFHTFHDIDYPFKTLPNNIYSQSNAKSIRKTGVNHANSYSDRDRLNFIHGELGIDAMVAYAREYARLRPDNSYMMWIVSDYLEPDEFIAFAQPFLKRRPLMLEWHRAYMGAVWAGRPEHDLFGEYQPIFQADPENRQAAFLMACVVDDDDEQMHYLTLATKEPNPCAHGFYELAFRLKNKGEFDKARTAIRKALKLQQLYAFTALEEQILILAGDFNPLIQRHQKRLNDMPDDIYACGQLVRYLTLTGRFREVDQAVNTYIDARQQWAQQNDTTLDMAKEVALLNSVKAAARNRVDAYLRACDESETPAWLCRAALLRGNFDAAAQQLDTLSDDDDDFALLHVLTLIAAEATGDELKIIRQLDRAVRALRAGPDGLAWVAGVLEGGTFEVDDLIQISMDDELKVAFLLAAARRHPDQSPQLTQHAALLDPHPGFMQMFRNKYAPK